MQWTVIEAFKNEKINVMSGFEMKSKAATVELKRDEKKAFVTRCFERYDKLF